MSEPTRIRATEQNGIVDVKLLIKHAMETGRRKDDAGKLIPIWHITQMTVKVKNKEVFQAHFGTGISKDPFIHFKFKGAMKGEEIVISWLDSRGDKRSDRALIV
jgi:sulfur-oxidizing protein SoxZ